MPAGGYYQERIALGKILSENRGIIASRPQIYPDLQSGLFQDENIAPAAASLADVGFLTVSMPTESYRKRAQDIFGEFFDSQGTAVGTPFKINQISTINTSFKDIS